MVMVALHHIDSINGQPHRPCRKYSDRELLVVYRPLVGARGTARNNCPAFRENPEIAVTKPKTSVVKKEKVKRLETRLSNITAVKCPTCLSLIFMPPLLPSQLQGLFRYSMFSLSLSV